MSYRVPLPVNEPILSYAPGTSERQRLKTKLSAMSAEKIEIPLVIGRKEIRTGDIGTQVMPHRHARPGGQNSGDILVSYRSPGSVPIHNDRSKSGSGKSHIPRTGSGRGRGTGLKGV